MGRRRARERVRAARGIRGRPRRLRPLPVSGEREHPLVRRAALDRAHDAQAIAARVSPASPRPTSNTARWSRRSLARELRLPGSDPAAIIRAQHKYYARWALAHGAARRQPACSRCCPTRSAAPRSPAAIPALPIPFFVKPVKAAYSVLARRVDDAQDLQRHLTFHPWETHIIKRLVRPFGDLMRQFTDFIVDPEHMLGEPLLDGVQINVDGWMDGGALGFFGIVDAVMYPGHVGVPALRISEPAAAGGASGASPAIAERAMRADGVRSRRLQRRTVLGSGDERASGHRDQSAPRRPVRRSLRESRRHQSLFGARRPLGGTHAAAGRAGQGRLRRRRELRIPRIQRCGQDRARQGADRLARFRAIRTRACTRSSSTATAAGAKPSGSATIAMRS